MRVGVTRFSHAMERQLRRSSHKGGWRYCDDTYLEGRLDEEVLELRSAINRAHLELVGGGISSATFKEIETEAADVGNFAMMLVEHWRQYAKPKARSKP